MKKIVILLTILFTLSTADEVSDILRNLEANILLSSDNGWMTDILDEKNTDESEKDISVHEMIRVINKYNHSKGHKKDILDAIIKTSIEFKISKRLLLASSIKESSINPLCKHAYVNVLVWKDKKRTKRIRIKTRALGMNGVIFEIHKRRLGKIGIHKDTDLYKPINSLRAMAKIINEYKKMKVIGGANNRLESALMRYYGVPHGIKARKVAITYMRKVLELKG